MLCAHDGQRLQHAIELALPAIQRQRDTAWSGRFERDGQIPAPQEVRGETCGDGDGILLGGAFVISCLCALVEIEQDNDINRRIEVEFFHHQLTVARCAWPVDACEGITRRVVAHGHHIGCRVQRPLGAATATRHNTWKEWECSEVEDIGQHE